MRKCLRTRQGSTLTVARLPGASRLHWRTSGLSRYLGRASAWLSRYMYILHEKKHLLANVMRKSRTAEVNMALRSFSHLHMREISPPRAYVDNHTIHDSHWLLKFKHVRQSTWCLLILSVADSNWLKRYGNTCFAFGVCWCFCRSPSWISGKILITFIFV